MRRLAIVALVALIVGAALVAPRIALAQDSAPDAGAPSVAPRPASASRGLAVLAIGDASGVAWPLARSVYAKEALRPSFDEPHARILAGEPPAPGASKELTDLSETRAAIHGDDAPSRQLLASIATSLQVRGIIVVVTSADSPPQARVFLADSSSFDAGRYAPDAVDGGGSWDWSSAVASFDRSFGGVVATPAPALATQAVPPLPPAQKTKEKDKETSSRPFYTSPWFWGAIGAAALGGTALYFATRDSSPQTVHLQLQVPK